VRQAIEVMEVNGLAQAFGGRRRDDFAALLAAAQSPSQAAGSGATGELQQT